MKRTSYKVPHYVVFSSLPPLPPSFVQTYRTLETNLKRWEFSLRACALVRKAQQPNGCKQFHYTIW